MKYKIFIVCAVMGAFFMGGNAFAGILHQKQIITIINDTAGRPDTGCDVETMVKVFNDVLHCRTITIGLNGSNACFSLKTANIPKVFTTWIQKDRTRGFDDVHWYATGNREHLDDISIAVVQSKSEPGSVVITVIPKPRYQPGAVVKIVLVGVEAGK